MLIASVSAGHCFAVIDEAHDCAVPRRPAQLCAHAPSPVTPTGLHNTLRPPEGRGGGVEVSTRKTHGTIAHLHVRPWASCAPQVGGVLTKSMHVRARAFNAEFAPLAALPTLALRLQVFPWCAAFEGPRRLHGRSLSTAPSRVALCPQ